MKISSRQAGGEQGLLFTLPAPALDLGSYHVIVVNISGGKDSQAALDETVRAAGAAGVRDRIVTVFADLGDEDEWPGTRELAAEHAAHYGLRHEVVCREVTGPDGQRVQQSLSEHIESRRQQKWPDAARRYCTSDLKRAPVRRLLTRLAAEQHAAGVTGRGPHPQRARPARPGKRPARPAGPVVPRRARQEPDRPLRRPVAADPQLDRGAGLGADRRGWHPAAPHLRRRDAPPVVPVLRPCLPLGALVLAARLDPEGAERRAAMERRMGHDFRLGLPMRDIIAEARTATGPVPVQDWAA